MKSIITIIIFVSFLSRSFGQTDFHKINLNLNLRPYTTQRSIDAQVFINGVYQTSFSADNSAFVRIVGQLPKHAIDTLIEIQIVVNSPVGYMIVDDMPFRYRPGIERSVTLATKDWIREHALTFVEDEAKHNADSALFFARKILDENILSNAKDEFKLRNLVANTYSSIGKYSEGYNSLLSISLNKVNSLNKEDQLHYFSSLLNHFKLKAISDTTSLTLVDAIYTNDTTAKSWQIFTSRVLASGAKNNINTDLLKADIGNKYIINAQIYEMTNKFGAVGIQ